MNMNLVNLFTRKETIAGLEISDTFVRLALLGFTKKSKDKPRILALAEEELISGTIVQGIIQDKPALIKALHAVVKKSGASVRYVIVSIPGDSVYSKVFSFPKTVQGERLEESMKLTVGFQLPVKPEDVHLDWEKIESPGSDLNDIYLAAVPRTITDSYIEALHGAKLSPVAIETHPLSLLRTLVHAPEDTLLIEIPGPASMLVSIVKNRIIQFSRTIPYNRIPKESVPEELRKIQEAYSAGHDPITATLTLKAATLKQDYMDNPVTSQNPPAWLVSLGAAERGLLDRSADTLISLMPVGTEEAYEYQKAISFMEFLTNMTIGLGIFFVAVFVGTFLFMNSLQDRSSAQLSRLNTAPVPKGAAELEQRATDINLLLGSLQQIGTAFPRWSPVVEEIRSRIIPGITVSSVTFGNPQDAISMNGTAKTRTQLNDFKKKLSESPLLTLVNIPLSYLDQKENIPFTASFKLKEPDLLYIQ